MSPVHFENYLGRESELLSKYKTHSVTLGLYVASENSTRICLSMTKSTRKSKPSPATHSTRAAAQLQTTEPFIIQSSFQKSEGPQPRVLRRRDDRYLLPRSPESPSPRGKRGPGSKAPSSSSSMHRRKKERYLSVNGLSCFLDRSG